MRVAIAMFAIALAGCATVPQQTVVAHATSLPPVSVAVPVSCVKKLPELPNVMIDPAATVLQRYYQMRALIADLNRYVLEAKPILEACAAAAEQPIAKETPK